MNRWALFIIGFLLVAGGLALVIKNWDILAIMVKASLGVLLSLIGLVMMFAASIRR